MSHYQPTATELELARTLARFAGDGGDLAIDDYRRIVDFLAVDLCRDTAAWKNAVMFRLTGSSALCTYRD